MQWLSRGLTLAHSLSSLVSIPWLTTESGSLLVCTMMAAGASSSNWIPIDNVGVLGLSP